MRTVKYYSVGRQVAEALGKTRVRYELEGDRFLLSETDLRGKPVFSDVREVSNTEARLLIAENGGMLGGRQTIVVTKEEEI